MKTVKILLHTSVAGKDGQGNAFNWSNNSEVDCEVEYAERLVASGQASYVAAKVQSKPKTTRKKVAAKVK